MNGAGSGPLPVGGVETTERSSAVGERNRSPRTSFARAVGTVLPLGGYVALAVLLTADVWTAAGSRWIGGCCDQEQMMWFLRWVPYALEHGLSPFFTDHLNAPAGVNLMWNASAPLLGLILSPVTLTLGPITAYNVGAVGAIASSCWLAYLALRRYTRGGVGPVIGGAVYAFSPYVASHAVLHLNLIAAWFPPLVLVLLDELLVRRARSARSLGAILGVLAACQLLSTEELLATTAVSAAAFVAILALVAPTEDRRREIVAAARRLLSAIPTALAAFAVIAVWPLTVQFLGPQRYEGRVQDPVTFSTDLLNLIVPTGHQLIAPAASTALSDRFSGLNHEATAYVGLPLVLILTAVVATRRSDVRIRVAGPFALVMFVFSLGPTLQLGGRSTEWPLPWLPFSHLPLLEHALPGRLTLFMWLAIGAVVAIAVDEALLRPMRTRAARLVALAAGLAFCLPAPPGSSTTDIPAFFEHWDRQGIPDRSIVLAAPYFWDGAGADPMLWAAVAGDAPRLYEAYAYVPQPDGRPGFGPPGTQLTDIMEVIQDEGTAVVARGDVRVQVAADLRAAGITDVVVGPQRYRGQMVAFFSDLFGRPALEAEDVQLWRNVDVEGVVTAP